MDWTQLGRIGQAFGITSSSHGTTTRHGRAEWMTAIVVKYIDELNNGGENGWQAYHTINDNLVVLPDADIRKYMRQGGVKTTPNKVQQILGIMEFIFQDVLEEEKSE